MHSDDAGRLVETAANALRSASAQTAASALHATGAATGAGGLRTRGAGATVRHNGAAPEYPPRALSAHAANRFYVEIGNREGSPIQAVFTEVSGLQVEMDVFQYEEGGNNHFVHKLPGRLKIGNITLKHGMTKSNDFLQWCLTPLRGKARIERKNVTVCLYDQKGKAVIRWHFDGAYPVKWTGPSFTADSTAVAIESVELAHKGLSVDTL